MTVTSILLIIVSACMHAWWNLRSKRSPSVAFFFVAMSAGSIALIPVLVYHGDILLSIPIDILLLLLVSSVFQFVYISGLAKAYQTGGMSIVYPVVRALPVLLVPVCNLIMGKGYQIGWLGLSGMVIIGVSCIIIPMKDFKDFRFENYQNRQTFFALISAIGTCGYSIIDDQAIRTMEQSVQLNLSKTSSSTIFWVLQSVLSTAWLGLYLLFSKNEKDNLRHLIKGFNWHPVYTGIILSVSYGLILLSMPYVTNVSYVVAFRQLSIPIGAALGIFVLRETLYFPKLVALICIFLGLIMVSIG
ncbi:hypothetical protein [Reichenbachiella sp. MALMAid0571]|uniref:hypothetical protein n=1 Tax=Reichenbachiella sp. MALMAid0571 TaxID=3143939 RepID=UPI0032E0193D